MDFGRTPVVSILLPVHNEAEIIADMIMAFYDEIYRKLPAELVVAEDGSTDGTKQILAHLSNIIPMRLFSYSKRKGYAKAVSASLRNSGTEWIFFSDADGQYSPCDFWKLWKERDDNDVIIGRKVRREEPIHRLILSGGFRTLINALLGLGLHDPDSGFRLIRQEVIQSIVDEVGLLEYSFWAEFTIRACLKGFRVREIPVEHKSRAGGSTRIYKPSKLPAIALKQIRGLVRLYLDVRKDL